MILATIKGDHRPELSTRVDSHLRLTAADAKVGIEVYAYRDKDGEGVFDIYMDGGMDRSVERQFIGRVTRRNDEIVNIVPNEIGKSTIVWDY